MSENENSITPLLAENKELRKRVSDLEELEAKHQLTLESLKESEEKFRNLAEKSPNMIFINQSGKIVYVNEACELSTGYSRDELLADVFDFMILIAPESKELVQKNFRLHSRGQEVPPHEYALISKDGRRIDAIYSTKLINYEGKPAIIGIVTDISARKLMEKDLKSSQESLKVLFELAPYGIITMDLAGRITSFNPVFEELTGYPGEMLLGKHFAEMPFLRPNELPMYLKMFKSIFQTKLVGPIEATWKNRDGSIRKVEARVSVMRKEGKVTGLQIFARDITEQKRYEKELLELKNHNENKGTSRAEEP
jgi:PAS domain S-box-containing protein